MTPTAPGMPMVSSGTAAHASADPARALSFPARVAAVDMGSNAIRFIAAEFSDRDRFTELEYERVPVRLGHDVFLHGKLVPEAMDAAVAAMTSFAARMESLETVRHRALATSAVREAGNGGEFVRRVRAETGLDLEVITGAEEARLVHLAVSRAMELGGERWVMVDLGGGSVEVSLVDADGILWTESHTMGSVRLLEELAGSADEPGRFRRLLAGYTSTLRIPAVAQHWKPAGLIATGGNIETLARLAGVPGGGGVTVLRLSALRHAITRISGLSYRERVDTLGLREDRADVILPAAMVYERLATVCGVDELRVPHVGVKEGTLLDLVNDLATHEAHMDRTDR